MDYSEFLKPTLKKIILSLLLILIFVPFINHDNGVRCITVPCDSETTSSLVMYLFADYKNIYYTNYMYLVIGVILSYALACSIINALERTK